MNTAKNLVLVSCICLSSSLRLDVQKLESRLSAPLVHVYFINIEARKDRCECMSTQLNKVSIPAWRQGAATPETYQALCPKLDITKAVSVQPKNHHLTKSEASLFCSHHMLWQRTYDDPNRPAFIAVLEDDTELSPNFSDKLTSFLESECTGAEWDFLAVDTFNGKLQNPITQCDAGGQQQVVTRQGGFGAHLTIVRTRSLHKLLNSTGFAMDDFLAYKDVSVGFVKLGLAAQRSKGPMKHEKAPIEGCSGSVKKGDITMIKSEEQVNSLKC